MYEDVNEPPLTPKRYQDNIKIKEPINPDKVVYSSHMELQEEPNTIVDYAPGKKSYKRVFYGTDGYVTKELHPNGHGNIEDHPYGNYGEHMYDYVFFDKEHPYRFSRELTDLERTQNADILNEKAGGNDVETNNK